MTTRLFRIGAWFALAAIIFVTVSPIGYRPRDLVSTNFDRAAAYAILSALFVFAYPRHRWTVAALMVATAGAAELFQFLSPMRHPHLMDAAVKAAGGGVGLCAGTLLHSGAARLRIDNRQ
ncbi:VanZ family protein [Shinella sp. BYT-45]|uniref:VanZ family protein n=1 Tax=Shinella sp. BYT-45 TaxID=3377377 RepID=UPI00397F1E81